MKKIRVSNIVLNSFENDSRVFKISNSLGKRGYLVDLYAIHKKGLKKQEKSHNFNINRIHLWSKRIPKNYFLKPFKLKALLIYFELAIKFMIRSKKTDFIHCNDVGTLPIGLIFKFFYLGSPKIVYDSHEYQSQVNGISKVESRVRSIIEKLIIPFCYKVINVNESISRIYEELYNVKTEIIFNAPNYKELKTPPDNYFRSKYEISKNQKIYLYQGGLSPGRGIEKILFNFNKLKEEGHNSSVLILLGNGLLEDLVKKNANENELIFYHPYVPMEDLSNYTRLADFGLLPYENTCLNHYYCLPNKLFEYAMSNVTVVASKLFELNNFISKNKIGYLIDNDDNMALYKFILNSSNKNLKISNSVFNSFNKKYNWEACEEILIKIYSKI